MKAWWKSKTLWVNVALAALMFAEANLEALKQAYGPAIYLWMGLVITVANVVLRFITAQPIGAKDDPQ